MNCKSDIACGHCTGIHKFKDCTMKHETPKCEAHTSDSTSCTAYLRQLITVYNARGVEIPISVKKRVASLYGASGKRSKEQDPKSELVLRSTNQIFEWD